MVLHAHLPYIRYPEHEHHLEERWLHEAITESYIPLLDVFGNLLNDNVDFRITLSLTPTLIEMFNDNLLMVRYQRYLNSLIDLAEKEMWRTRRDADFAPLSRMYHKRFLRIRHLFEDVYGKDLTSAFCALASSGKIEIMTSAATHAYLPALINVPNATRAQIMVGTGHFEKTFGRKPYGMWLPECGFTPGIDVFLKEAGIHFFFLENHGGLNSTPMSRYGAYAPLKTPSGIVAFSRDVESSKIVWSSREGYPGDFDYRDFYRDIGFDLDLDYIRPYLPEGIRTFTCLKYYRVTGRSDAKKPYIAKKALEKAKIHADHFVKAKKEQIILLREKLGIEPLITAAYDAELFGHWWFEGPEWLNLFLRKGSLKKNSLKFITPSEYISEHSSIDRAVPSLSSWGDKGYSSTWINDSNGWIYRHLNRAARLMVDMARKKRIASALKKRALNQAARELLLAQASDWAFMMKTGTASEFAKNKFTEHMKNFFALQREITSGLINKDRLSHLETKNNLFRDIDYRIYGEV